MKIKLNLLVTVGVLFLTSCLSMDINYLDDNYSDRVELAQKLLGNDSVYFDTSSYNKTESLSAAIPITEIRSSRKLVGGGFIALLEQFKLINESYRKIAVSGNVPGESAKLILAALAQMESGKLSNVQILYIGELRYLPEIKQAVEACGAEFFFAEMPETSI